MNVQNRENHDEKGGTPKPDFVVPLFQRHGNENVEFLGTEFLIDERTLLTSNHVVTDDGDPETAKPNLFFPFGDEEKVIQVTVDSDFHSKTLQIVVIL